MHLIRQELVNITSQFSGCAQHNTIIALYLVDVSEAGPSYELESLIERDEPENNATVFLNTRKLQLTVTVTN